MNQKVFIAVRIDIGGLTHRCQKDLSFLNFDPALLCCAIVNNYMRGTEYILDTLLRLLKDVPAYQQNKQYVEKVALEIGEHFFYILMNSLPHLSPALCEIIPMTTGELDCIVYVESNEHSKSIIPAVYHSRTYDEFAIRHVAGQYH